MSDQLIETLLLEDKKLNNKAITFQNLSVVKKIQNSKFPIFLAYSKTNQQAYVMKMFYHIEGTIHPFFKNEIRFSKLKHPNVIDMIYYDNERKILERGQLKTASYILMEYAPHGDLLEFIMEYGNHLDQKMARTLFRQIIEGLEYLHLNNVAHLDLKPENLLVSSDFNLKIADFDLSHITGDTSVLGKGTRYYRAPELFQSNSSSLRLSFPFAADIYSAGIVLFILKSGGLYPHTEYNLFNGINLIELLQNNNDAFWKAHCELQNREDSFFDEDFKFLFNAMMKAHPTERISIPEIKMSKWYNGNVYTPVEFKEQMKHIIGEC